MNDHVHIDGSQGEGGGQILRSALSLSLITGRPFTIENIRARRSRPGLMRQHLASIHAAAKIGGERATGDEPGSTRLEFYPGPVRGGEFHFSIGTAGSCTLLLQTVLPALCAKEKSARILLEGGTHNPFAPPYDFLELAFLPVVRRLFGSVKTELIRPGFYPAGGGKMAVQIDATPSRETINLFDRGKTVSRQARVLFANLPFSIAEREKQTLIEKLGWSDDEIKIQELKNSAGPGNVVMSQITSENVTEIFTGFGEKGRSAENVAGDCVRQTKKYLAEKSAVAENLADQLLLPFAIAGRGSFSTAGLSPHARTNIEIIRLFLECSIRTKQSEKNAWMIEIG